LMVSPTNVFACWTQVSENEEKYEYSVTASSGLIRAGICSNRQSSHSRRCSGKVGSGKSSSPGVRDFSHSGVAPRSNTLSSPSESHKRQCSRAAAVGALSLVPRFTAHRAEGARTAVGAHRGPGASGKPGPTRESRDQLLPTQQGHRRPTDRTNRHAGHSTRVPGTVI
jgi:hypothetical protein